MKCPLCQNPSEHFYTYSERNYLKCSNCKGVFLCVDSLPDAEHEKNRYEQHENSLANSGYIAFLSPIIDYVSKNFRLTDMGLDYGCGPNPVLAKLLQAKGYTISTYDPFFEMEVPPQHNQYDYIICCEVMEHFHNPELSFTKLKSYLKPKGILVCHTALFDESIAFPNWYYKNDSTHSFFYTAESLLFIKAHFGFKELTIHNNLIVLKNT